MISEKVLDHPQIEVRFETVVEAFLGAHSKLRALRVRQAGRPAEELALPGAFVFIGLDPHTAWLQQGPVHLDRHGFVVTGHALVHGDGALADPPTLEPAAFETSLAGVFAAGDVRAGSTKQVASAAGEGAAAALMVRDYLKTV